MRTLRRLASVGLLVIVLGLLGGGAQAGAQPFPPIPGPIPSPIPDPIGGAGGVFPTCMVDPVDCFVNGLVAMLARDASGFIQSILNSVASEATFNPAAPGFLQQYSLGFGIAVFVLCVLLMRLFYKMSRHADRMPQYRESLLHYLPLGLALCAAGPGLGALLADMSNALTEGIISASSSPDQMFSSIDNVITGLLNAPTPIISILVLIALILSAVMVIVTLLLQSLALYLTGSVMAIAFVMMIDPELRQKAARMPMAWLGILLAKPLLFFMMGTVVALVTGGGMAADPIIGGLMAVLALLMVALAPMTLRKFAPIIPGGGDATASGASGAMIGGSADMASTVSQQQMMSGGSAYSGWGGGGAANSQVQIGSQRASSVQNGSSTNSNALGAPTNHSYPMDMFRGAPTAPSSVTFGMPGAGAGSAAATGATGGAAAGAAAIAGPLGLAAVGVKAAKDFAESAAPNIEGSE